MHTCACVRTHVCAKHCLQARWFCWSRSHTEDEASGHTLHGPAEHNINEPRVIVVPLLSDYIKVPTVVKSSWLKRTSWAVTSFFSHGERWPRCCLENSLRVELLTTSRDGTSTVSHAQSCEESRVQLSVSIICYVIKPYVPRTGLSDKKTRISLLPLNSRGTLTTMTSAALDTPSFAFPLPLAEELDSPFLTSNLTAPPEYVDPAVSNEHKPHKWKRNSSKLKLKE